MQGDKVPPCEAGLEACDGGDYVICRKVEFAASPRLASHPRMVISIVQGALDFRPRSVRICLFKRPLRFPEP